MNYVIKKTLFFLAVSTLAIQVYTECMESEKDVLSLGRLQMFPRETQENIIKMVIEEAFGAHFEPLKESATGKSSEYAIVSPDKKTVLIASSDNTVRLFEIETGNELQEFKGPSDSVYSLAWSPDGNFIAAGYAGLKAYIWDRQTGDRVQEFITKGSVTELAFSPDGTVLLIGLLNGNVQLIDRTTQDKVRTLQRKPTLQGLTGTVNAAAFSPDGNSIVVGYSYGNAHLWDKNTGKLLYELKVSGNVLSVAWSPDGKTILLGCSDGKAILWDKETGKVLQELKKDSSDVWAVTFSSDSKFVLTGAENGKVSLWEAATGQLLREFLKHKGSILTIALSSDQETMITVSSKGDIILWGASWDSFKWATSLTKPALEAAKKLFVTKLYQLFAKSERSTLQSEEQ